MSLDFFANPLSEMKSVQGENNKNSYNFDARVEVKDKQKSFSDESKHFDPDKRVEAGDKKEQTLHYNTEKFDSDKRVEIPEDRAPEKIKCINEKLVGKCCPETGVLFEKRLVEIKGKQYEVVVPHFDSKFDAQLPPDKLKERNYKQFKECNAQLKETIGNNEKLKEKFTDEQLEQIKNGETPKGYIWHHDADVGKMQLVDAKIHSKTPHTGGRKIWGGGNENK